MNKLTSLFACIALLGLSGCEQEGPAERLGESIDNATEDVRDAADDLGNEIEDACEDVKKGAGAKDTDC